MVEDTWHCDPASIVSTLCFQKSNSSDSITSPCCGMGWQFRVSSDKTGAAPGQATLTRLFFDPQGFLRSLSPRNLKFSVIADPGTTVPSNYFVPSLDEFSSSGVELGTYSHPQNETMTFRITLYFSEGLKLKFSHAPQSSQDAPADMIDVMYDAVKGKEVVDCVFYLYSASAKGVKGQISKPRAVYANLALLRGHCTYLDALLGDGSQEALAVDSSQIAPVSWNYDYDSDSDFEEDLEDDSPETQNVNTNAATPDDANPISDAETVPGCV
ncbi:hypothetical protein VKT23_006937 [Stygiomarasmius scandens]|uniref:MATH domain-containing protein n=1 Tax=Marasmiellus scandens TaxID=2682957 RepID=A0ABR1JLW4_9AGAR